MPASQDQIALDTFSRPDAEHFDEEHFEDLLTRLALSFVNVEPHALDDLLVASLRRIVRFLGVDRSSLGRYDMLPGQMVTTHSWAAPGIEPVPSPIAESRLPFVAARVRAGHGVICDRVAELPPEAEIDRESLQRLGLRSVAVFPLSAADEALGWLSFGTVRRDYLWSSDQVRRLRLIAGVFANALLRQRKDLELDAAMAENLALRRRLEAANEVWREQVLHCHDFDELVGKSQSLRRVLTQVEQVAPTDSDGPDPGRNGHRQGADCARHPRRAAAVKGSDVRFSQLRRHAVPA